MVTMSFLMVLYLVNNTEVTIPSMQQFYQNNQNLLSLMSLFQSVVLSLTNLAMFSVFLYLFLYFLEFRERKANAGSHKKLTPFNIFIISWVIFICVLTLLNIGTTLTNGIAIYLSGDKINFQSQQITIYFLMPMYKIVIPFKDFLIVLSFIYLYFY